MERPFLTTEDLAVLVSILVAQKLGATLLLLQPAVATVVGSTAPRAVVTANSRRVFMLTVRVEEMQRSWPRLFSQVAPGSALAPALLLAFSKLRERNLPGRDRHAL